MGSACRNHDGLCAAIAYRLLIPINFKPCLAHQKHMNSEPITLLLRELSRGQAHSDDRVAAAVIQALERIAEREFARRGGAHGLTLEPRIFAHDALLKVLSQRQVFISRGQFFAYATQIMVHAMIDYHRARQAHKRGGAFERVSWSEVVVEPDLETDLDLACVPPALEQLQLLDPRKADVVRLRVFWGASMDEIAHILGVSITSIERDWRFAKRWLVVNLKTSSHDSN